jgi:FtsP/CotA-like multicopper oxidase with cupredoxin domain
MLLKRISVLCSSGLWCLLAIGCSGQAPSSRAQQSDVRGTNESVDDDPPTPEPLTVDKIKLWENVLEKPAVFVPVHKHDDEGKPDEYQVTVQVGPVQMLPKPLPTTQALTYGGKAQREGAAGPDDNYQSSPGPTFEMDRGTPAHVKWINLIQGKHVLPEAQASIPTAAQDKVPIVTHVHGLEVAPASDGSPTAWFTYDPTGKTSPTYEYPNSQPATALWYHDHTFGITQYNVYAGLAGAYIIRDKKKDSIEFPPSGKPVVLPDRAHEWPLVFQDRSFKTDGSFEYFGGNITNVVNGKVWPRLDVDRTLYRFRLLNGSDARYYNLALSSGKITVIGSDGGYLPAPKTVDSVKLAPGERADVLVDFSGSKEGDLVTLNDLAAGPDLTQPLNQILRFTVSSQKPPLPAALPAAFNALPDLVQAPTKVPAVKTMTLHQASSALLNGQPFSADVSEKPTLNTTEDWDLVNIAGSDHPIHLHLVQFQVVSRRTFDVEGYKALWTAANSATLPLSKPTEPVPVPETSYTGTQALSATESGWKDTVDVPTDTVTRIRVRWAPQEPEAGTTKDNPFLFNPDVKPGYVWHCHILDHEDNEMMRPFLPERPTPSANAPSGPLG